MGFVNLDITLRNGLDVYGAIDGLIPNQSIRSFNTNILIDTGAISLCINQKVKDQLGLKSRGTSSVSLADGNVTELEMCGPVEISTLQRSCMVEAFVLPNNADMLMGVVPLELMDLLIDTRRQEVIPNPLHPEKPIFMIKSLQEIEPNIEFKPETLKEIDRIIKQFPEGKQKSALLRVLHMAQNEFGNWLSVETMDYVARLLHLNPIEVYEVATFYSMYNVKKVGKVVIEVCRTGPCCLVGAERILTHIEHTLNIKPGQTTDDGMFTLKAVECLGACGYGPMLQIGETYHENLTEEKVDNLLNDLRIKNS